MQGGVQKRVAGCMFRGTLTVRKENPDEPDDPHCRVYANGGSVAHGPGARRQRVEAGVWCGGWSQGKSADGCRRRPERADAGNRSGQTAPRRAGVSSGGELLRGRAGGVLAPPVPAVGGSGKRSDGLLEHRGESAASPGEDGWGGPGEVAVVVDPFRARGEEGVRGSACADARAGGRAS